MGRRGVLHKSSGLEWCKEQDYYGFSGALAIGKTNNLKKNLKKYPKTVFQEQ